MYRTLVLLMAVVGLGFNAGASALDSGRSGSVQTLSWSVKIPLKDSGTVAWKTSLPFNSGALTASGKITFNAGSFIDLTFTPKAGFKLLAVFKNADNVVLDAQNHVRFGPVDGAHVITAVFTEIVPTGIFNLSFPDRPVTLTNILDVTGSYKGSITLPKATRTYDLKVAQDEFGKIQGMGTVSGVVDKNDPTGQTWKTVGSVKSEDSKPAVAVRDKFEGTVDGLPAKLSGSASAAIDVATLASGINAQVSYKGDIGGVPVSANNVTMTIPPNPANIQNVKRAWTIQLNIVSTTVKGKPLITASALLSLPNKEQIAYPAIKTKYSAAKGYSMSFKGGTNISRNPNVPNKSAAVTLKGVTLIQSSSTWVVTGGTIGYKFLGQKGQGNLSEFLLK